jgi:branched-chain amino acid transport system permease protein
VKRPQWVILAGALGLFALAAVLVEPVNDCVTGVYNQFWAQTRNGLTRGSIYAMIALGYTMVYGVLQLINFAHSEVFMVSAFAMLHTYTGLFTINEPAGGLTLIGLVLAGLAICMLASGMTAVGLERFAYRPLRRRGAPRLSFLISAIGASLFIQYLFNLADGQHYLLWLRLPDIAGATPRSIPEVMDSSTVFTVFGTDVSNKRILVVIGAGLMLFVLDRFVRGTHIGRGIRAVAQDSEAAAIMGVNIDRVVVVTFLVGGLMAGAAGYLYVTVLGVPAFWFMGFIPGIKAFTAAVLGGIGNIRGAMLGGLTRGLVEAYSVACYGADWIDVTAFIVLVLVLLFRPTGILGEEVGH